MTNAADAKTAKAYRRPVSATEIMWNASDADTPFYNQLVIEYADLPDGINWEQAAASTTAANPGAALKRSGLLAWEKWRYGNKPFPVQTHTTQGGIAEAIDELPMSLHSKKGPVCDVWRIKHAAGEALVLRSLHAVMDGAGHIHWANDFINALNQRPLVGAMSTWFDRQFAEAKVGRRDPADRVRARPNCKPLTRGTHNKPKRYFHYQVAKPARELTPDVLHSLGMHALGKGIDRLRVVIPSNLRTYDSTVKSTGNLTGSFNLEFNAGSSREQLAMSMITYLYKKHDTLFPAFHRFAAWLPRSLIYAGFKKRAENMLKWSVFDFSGVVSNLGELDKNKLTIGGTEARNAYFISPHSHYFPMFVCLTGFNGGTNITFAIPETLQADCDAFFRQFEADVVEKYQHGAAAKTVHTATAVTG